MRLAINNLRSKGPSKARSWIYVRLSHNQSSANTL
jgi:hypothetical protein